MPFNKLAVYSTLLSLEAYTLQQRNEALLFIYERDIYNNPQLKFRGKGVRPMKSLDNEATKLTHLAHLINKESVDEFGVKKRDNFDIQRSKRLHWVKYHICETNPIAIKVFNYIDRIKGIDYRRTYIYDEVQKYVVILEPKRDGSDNMYLITAFYFDEPYYIKQLNQKFKKRVID